MSDYAAIICAFYKSFINGINLREIPHQGDSLNYTRFEKARIIGARALQISLGAPILVEIPPGMFDPVEIAMLEFSKNVIPITVLRET